jgi:hypothetical protein
LAEYAPSETGGTIVSLPSVSGDLILPLHEALVCTKLAMVAAKKTTPGMAGSSNTPHSFTCTSSV